MNSSYLKHKFYNQIYLKILDTNKNSNNVKQIVEQNLHLRHYYVASKIFKDNLVFGSGFKTFRIESHKQKYKKDVYGSSTHPHQIHFELLAELGLVGYFLIISNLLFLLTINLKQKKTISQLVLHYLFWLHWCLFCLQEVFSSYGAIIFFINYSFLIRPKHLNVINFELNNRTLLDLHK